MKFWVFIVRRIALMVPVLIGVVTITFLLLNTVPLDDQLSAHYSEPKSGWNSPTPAAEARKAAAEAALGLNKPVPVQYATYLYNTFTLNWGNVSPNSYMTTSGTSPIKACGQNCQVMTIVEAWLPYTMELALLSLALILVLAIPLGNYSAVYRNRPVDQATRIFSFSGFALPSYVLGAGLIILCIYLLGDSGGAVGCAGSYYNQILYSWPSPTTCFTSLFSQTNNLPPYMNALYGTSPTGFPAIDSTLYAIQHAPPAGEPSNAYWQMATTHVVHLLLPAITIAYGSVAGILRFVRNSMLEVMNLDFIRTARSKGVPERQVIRRHAGRNSLNVTITVLGLTFAGFLGGFAVIEDLFQLFGVGRMFTYALVQPYDLGTIFASTILFTIIIVAANILVDIIYGALDPRVRLG